MYSLATRTVVFSIFLALSVVAMAAPGFAGDGVITKASNHDAKTTLDRLEKILADKGITVFARIDHSAGAETVGQTLTPTEVLIFGSPKMGTPLITSNRTIAIDLPMKALAWTDINGRSWLAYNDAAYLKSRHKIDDRDMVFEKMAQALNGLTDAAVK